MTRHICVALFLLCLVLSCLGLSVQSRGDIGVKIQEPKLPPTNRLLCDIPRNEDRFDCFPMDGSNEGDCVARGCCWVPPVGAKNTTALKGAGKAQLDVPYCFYPSDYVSYSVASVSDTELGISASLEMVYASPYPNNIQTLQLDASFETENRLRLKISDPNNARYETPFPPAPSVSSRANDANYEFRIQQGDFGFQVIRQSDNTVIFDVQSSSGFTFSDQFIQITSRLPSSNVYGIGEHRDNFRLQSNWNSYTLFNHDRPPGENINLYGAHPFYLVVEESGASHGVFLRNSNAMEVVLQPSPAITFRPIGGVLDFYFFLGPTPDDVIRQYTDVIGKPFMPPFWSLGFQLCRYGYNSLENTRAAYQRTRDAGIPFDVQWNDIDYMENHDDFTWDHNNFAGLPEFIDELHSVGMRYVSMIDGGIAGSRPAGTYPPFDDGVEMGCLVKTSDGSPAFGTVWNDGGLTAFPDYTHPRAVEYFEKQLRELRQDLRFDGLWIDMNEPANFVDGTANGCPDTSLENPPYNVKVDGGVLRKNTLCMSHVQTAGLHYDVHNLYGATMTYVANEALRNILGTRPFIISRSTFAGQGKYGGHWSGDNYSSWYDMYKSISQMLNFNIFGIPMMGSDICGFNGETNPALCQRWQQLGAFYPFSRNHNTIGTRDQDPAALGQEVADSAKMALNIRYSLLPFLYTLFYESHITGSTVAKALFFEFPQDAQTLTIDTQFLWGPSFMVVPVLEEGATSVLAYFPGNTKWYAYSTGEPMFSDVGIAVNVDAPLDFIPLYVRAGYILPKLVPAVTTTETRNNPFELLVAVDPNGQAKGNLYWDDGETIDAGETGLYNLIQFSENGGQLTSTAVVSGYDTPMPLNKVTVYGATAGITSVQINGADTPFTQQAEVLTIDGIQGASLLSDLTITWS